MVVFYRRFHCSVCRSYTTELNGMIGEFDTDGSQCPIAAGSRRRSKAWCSKEATMEQQVKASPRIEPLLPEQTPELAETFDKFRETLGFVPNSMLILQRKPKLVRAMAQLLAEVWEPDGEVDRAFKRLIAHVASRTAGCQYCMAHTAGGALFFGIDPAKVADICDFRTSPRYSEAERVALDFAIAAASVPNGVTEEMFADVRKHWGESQIVEIVAVVAVFGFLNRWNDTMGTPLEAEPIAVGRKYLASHGWSVGKHAR
jgi:uncharacterized peroxidase-related enzyme